MPSCRFFRIALPFLNLPLNVNFSKWKDAEVSGMTQNVSGYYGSGMTQDVSGYNGNGRVKQTARCKVCGLAHSGTV